MNTKKKTSTITFRIDKEYEKILREESELKGVSLNVLANQIFRDYAEWHRYMKTFGTIVMSKDAFRLIIDELDEKSLIRLAVEIGEKAPKEFILFKWKDLNADNVTSFMKMFFDHCGYGKYDQQTRLNKQIFSIRHDLGFRGSLFLKAYLEAVIHSTLGRECVSTVSENSLSVTFEI
jgi:hypothetical protein